jgi:hypothetical protein
MSVAGLSASVDISTGTSNVLKRPEKKTPEFQLFDRGNCGRWIAV